MNIEQAQQNIVFTSTLTRNSGMLCTIEISAATGSDKSPGIPASLKMLQNELSSTVFKNE